MQEHIPVPRRIEAAHDLAQSLGPGGTGHAQALAEADRRAQTTQGDAQLVQVFDFLVVVARLCETRID